MPFRICHKGHSDQLVGIDCKPCHKIASLKWARKSRYESPEKAGWASLRDNAKRKGLLLGISYSRYLELRAEPCHYCGESFERGKASYALDRIDNTLGYLEENVVVCCYTCNHAKANMSTKEFMKMCHLVAARFPQLEIF